MTEYNVAEKIVQQLTTENLATADLIGRLREYIHVLETKRPKPPKFLILDNKRHRKRR